MSAYESEPGVERVRIRTFRQMRRERRWGGPSESEHEPVLYTDFFRDEADPLTARRRRH